MSAQSDAAELLEIRTLASPLRMLDDLDPLLEVLDDRRLIAIGEASHGTHEFYVWRAELTRRLIEAGSISFIGVEGDWPDCWRIDQWARGHRDAHLDARHMLAGFERWPTWMWANEEVADFLDWLRAFNLEREERLRVGFFGLDVYSLWDSLREVFRWLEHNAPEAIPDAMRAWECFLPFGEDPQRYAHSTALVPEGCERDVVELLVAVRHRVAQLAAPDAGALAAAQNAAVVAGAEKYYRAMVRSNRVSWNVRDFHMADTLDRLRAFHGPDSRAIVWAHNTHVGDSRATDMAGVGMITIGEILRRRHGDEGVALVGMAGHRGEVIAAAAWGADATALRVPVARPGTHEDQLHRALGRPSVLLFDRLRSSRWLQQRRGHRAIGVVYQPPSVNGRGRGSGDGDGRGNDVPTVMGDRYDALLWFEDTSALAPLHHEREIWRDHGRDHEGVGGVVPAGAELETEPTGW